MLRKIGAATFAAMLAMGSSAAFAEKCGTGSTSSTPTTVQLPNAKGFQIMSRSTNKICISFDSPAAISGGVCGADSYTLQPESGTAAGGSYSTPIWFSPRSFSIISAAGSDAYSCTYLR